MRVAYAELHHLILCNVCLQGACTVLVEKKRVWWRRVGVGGEDLSRRGEGSGEEKRRTQTTLALGFLGD